MVEEMSQKWESVLAIKKFTLKINSGDKKMVFKIAYVIW